MARIGFFVVCIVAALTPRFEHPASIASVPDTVHWPSDYDGRPLHRLPINSVEEKFYADFPGSAAHFSDGECDLIFRWITKPTRKLHSAAECFRGLGYDVSSPSLIIDSHGTRWRSFTANRTGVLLKIREQIVTTETNEAWTDTSAWYWSATLNRTRGPWMAVTIIERE